MIPQEFMPSAIDKCSGWKHNTELLQEITTATNDEIYIEDEIDYMEKLDHSIAWILEHYTLTKKD